MPPTATPGVVVTPVPPLVGVAFTAVCEYTNPLVITAGQVPRLVTFPFKVAETSKIAVAPVLVFTTGATTAVPVPVNAVVGELLPDVVLATVTVAFLAPAADGVKVTT